MGFNACGMLLIKDSQHFRLTSIFGDFGIFKWSMLRVHGYVYSGMLQGEYICFVLSYPTRLLWQIHIVVRWRTSEPACVANLCHCFCCFSGALRSSWILGRTIQRNHPQRSRKKSEVLGRPKIVECKYDKSGETKYPIHYGASRFIESICDPFINGINCTLFYRQIGCPQPEILAKN